VKSSVISIIPNEVKNRAIDCW